MAAAPLGMRTAPMLSPSKAATMIPFSLVPQSPSKPIVACSASSTRVGVLTAVPDVPVVNRTVEPPPPPLAVMHSSAYNQAKRNRPASTSAEDGASEASTSAPAMSALINSGTKPVAPRRPVDANDDSEGIMWALRQLDKSLDELEENPLPLQTQIYQITKSPVGQASGVALEAAAKLTLQAGKEAFKAAVPVAGWLAKEGAKAAVTLAANVAAQNAKSKK